VIVIPDIGYQISGSSGEEKDLTQRSEEDEEQRAQREAKFKKRITTEIAESLELRAGTQVLVWMVWDCTAPHVHS